MFSRSRRQSKVQRPPDLILSDVSDAPLPSPAFNFDAVRPSSSDSARIGQRKSRIAFGPPVLPPIPRIASTKAGPKDTSIPELPAFNFDGALSGGILRPQRSFDHFSRPRSAQESMPFRGTFPRQASFMSLEVPMRASVFAADETQAGAEKEVVKDVLDINFDSPVMEASVFPSFTPAQSIPVLPDSPIANRSFIDSRDRPYSQPRLRSPPVSQYGAPSPFAQHYTLPISPSSARPTKPRTPSSIGTVSMTSSEPTIGLPFESTSIKHPPPKLVSTRPKNNGIVSKVAGVDVPTHHTSGVKGKNPRRKSLNPVALFGRKKSAHDTLVQGEDQKKAQAIASERQKAVASVGVPKLPDDYDPRIKGKIVHDFSSPRRTTLSPVQANFPNGIFTEPPAPARYSQNLTPQQARISRSPVFVENFSDERPLSTDRSSGGLGAEHRENKSFLARFSQQSTASTFSQESAILPPFARKSQILDAANPAMWRDEEGSWSSGRDSGANSSNTPDRESNLSSFSLVSPITGRSSGSQGMNGMSFAFDSLTGNLSPVSPSFDRKDPMDRPISIFSHGSEKARPRSVSESTTRPVEPVPEPVLPPEPERPATPDQDDRRSLPSQRRARAAQAQAGAEIETSPEQKKRDSRRFSFQSGVDAEKALEKMPEPEEDVEDDLDYFDENAINDLDELELELEQMPVQLQPEALTETYPKGNKSSDDILPPEASDETLPKVSKADSGDFYQPEASDEMLSKVKRTNSDDFFYEGHIPYQSNERELTYAEHPVFRSHSAFNDSRRTSLSSTLLDSYLQSSPTSSSPRRGQSAERRGSTPSILTGNRSSSGSSVMPGTRGTSTTQATSTSIMSPLPEHDEAGDPSTPVVDGALQAFKFSDSPDKSLQRQESDAEKPKWSRTADLWKQYSTETPDRGTTPSTLSNRSSNVGTPRVKKPTGVRNARNSIVESRASNRGRTSRKGDRLSSYSQKLESRGSTALSDSRPTSKLVPLLVPQNTTEGVEIGVASSEEPLQAYHQALADAANKAAAAGRFTRQASVITVDTTIMSPPEADASPNKMAFDFGFDDQGFDDDDMVAAANADALASDDDGFYSSEFGFYAKAKAGIDVSSAVDGGFFGEDGDDGLARQRSLKEPNLTPITERSEFSTRNSFVGLGGFTPTIATPLARIPNNALSEGDIVNFEQLKRLRQSAFGGSSVSLSSKDSPTSPHFTSSIAASDSTGSVDSRHQSAILEDLNHNAASLAAHKSSPLTSH